MRDEIAQSLGSNSVAILFAPVLGDSSVNEDGGSSGKATFRFYFLLLLLLGSFETELK